MKNFIQAGVNLTLPAPYAVVSGGGALIGKVFGIAAGDADNGADVDLVTTGVFELPKVSTDEFAVGAAAYWDDATKLVTADDAMGANSRIGVAVTAAANPSASVQVRLDGHVV